MTAAGPLFRLPVWPPIRRLPLAALRRGGGLMLRVLAGTAGGYALAALATAVLSVTLPMARAEAVLAATMASFAVWTAAVVWAFAARSAPRALAGLAVVASLLFLTLTVLEGRSS